MTTRGNTERSSINRVRQVKLNIQNRRRKSRAEGRRSSLLLSLQIRINCSSRSRRPHRCFLHHKLMENPQLLKRKHRQNLYQDCRLPRCKIISILSSLAIKVADWESICKSWCKDIMARPKFCEISYRISLMRSSKITYPAISFTIACQSRILRFRHGTNLLSKGWNCRN